MQSSTYNFQLCYPNSEIWNAILRVVVLGFETQVLTFGKLKINISYDDWNMKLYKMYCSSKVCNYMELNRWLSPTNVSIAWWPYYCPYVSMFLSRFKVSGLPKLIKRKHLFIELFKKHKINTIYQINDRILPCEIFKSKNKPSSAWKYFSYCRKDVIQATGQNVKSTIWEIVTHR